MGGRAQCDRWDYSRAVRGRANGDWVAVGEGTREESREWGLQCPRAEVL